MSMVKIHYLIIVSLLLLSFSLPLSASSHSWKEIEEELIDDLEKSPHDLLLTFELSVCYAKTGRIEEAYALFNALKEMDSTIKPEEVPAIYREKLEEGEGEEYPINLSYLAFAYYVINDYQSAIEAFMELIDLEPDSIWNYNYLALIYRDLDLLLEAEKILKESLVLEENSYTRFILGLTYYDQGRYVRALLEFGRARDVARDFLGS